MAHLKKHFCHSHSLSLSLSHTHTHSITLSQSDYLPPIIILLFSGDLYFEDFTQKKPFPILFQTMRSLTLTFTNNISRGQTQ